MKQNFSLKVAQREISEQVPDLIGTDKEAVLSEPKDKQAVDRQTSQSLIQPVLASDK